MGRREASRERAPQRFQLRVDGHDYLAEVHAGVRLRATLLRDGVPIASGSTLDETLRIATPRGATRLEVQATRSGRVRRATLRLGMRELDLDPEPGSRAATRLEKERAHPLRYAGLDVLLAVGRVLLPLLGLGALLAAFLEPLERWARDHLPHLHLPDIPWPDLPDIPWPSIDLSWIPEPPPWLAWALDHVGDAMPVVVALVVARYEIRRRRRQDQLKAELAERERRVLLERLGSGLRALEERRPGPDEAAPGGGGDGIRSRGDRPDP